MGERWTAPLPVDGFSLAYDRAESGPPVVLLHGWPGDRTDYDAAGAAAGRRLRGRRPGPARLRESDKHLELPAEAYSADAQARSVTGLLDELGLARRCLPATTSAAASRRPSRRDTPERVRALVVSPPLPGRRAADARPRPEREFWYQPFHRLALPEQILDGNRDAIRTYLAHFWSHWSGPGFEPSAAHLDRLADALRPAGHVHVLHRLVPGGTGHPGPGRWPSRTAALAEPILLPTRPVLWPPHDPLFLAAWADRLGEFFADVTVTPLPDSGHFVPLEAPDAVASAIRERR